MPEALLQKIVLQGNILKTILKKSSCFLLIDNFILYNFGSYNSCTKTLTFLRNITLLGKAQKNRIFLQNYIKVQAVTFFLNKIEVCCLFHLICRDRKRNPLRREKLKLFTLMLNLIPKSLKTHQFLNKA